ncbi:hypothetical protein [Tautonia plasticadhaerens]|uniref:Uncharacterized protein n=1 Tax=Tautonia plasticadhaerens TaxID=2527974 RepID=A0A518HA52_9BACT|nr:hypothetical protein [Tautonia plasticadhaerens]QDV37728.1 hypothetical protein ElP_56730 [Tautonia plasticadhaerens]
MRFRLTFITGFSLLLMAAGLYLSFAGVNGDVARLARYLLTTLGIVGWFIGNRLGELDERVAELERLVTAQQHRVIDAECRTAVGSAVPPQTAPLSEAV